MDFKSKYLKYKKKYLELKKLIEGGGGKCANCGKDNIETQCQCKQVYYCNVGCQRANFSIHKKVCPVVLKKDKEKDDAKQREADEMARVLADLTPAAGIAAFEEITKIFVRPADPAALSVTIDKIWSAYDEKSKQFPPFSSEKSFLTYRVRELFVEHFSWAIPHSSTIAGLASKLHGYKNILEVGAGSGLWTHLLRNLHKVPIHATDILDGSYGYDKKFKYCEIEKIDAISAIEKHDPEVLMMVWAPLGKPMANNCLKAFKGNLLVWIGEDEGGCNGDYNFFEELRKNWEVMDNIDMPSWFGINDYCTVYQRKVLNPAKLFVGEKKGADPGGGSGSL